LGGGAKLIGQVNPFFESEEFQYILAKNFCANAHMFVDQHKKPPVPLYLRAPDATPSFSFLNQGK